MPTTHDEILEAALSLSEAERLSIATRLLETLAEDLADLRDADGNVDGEFENLDELIAEWDRRANDGSEPIPLSDLCNLWKQDRNPDSAM